MIGFGFKITNHTLTITYKEYLYIDIYGKGMEFATRQMIDVVNGTNTFNPGVQKFENIRGQINKIVEGEMKVIYEAISYAEPISRYLILLENQESEISYSVEGESMFNSSFNVNVELNNGVKTNAIFVSLLRSTTPSFPIEPYYYPGSF
jgi:hypothetical protein